MFWFSILLSLQTITIHNSTYSIATPNYYISCVLVIIIITVFCQNIYTLRDVEWCLTYYKWNIICIPYYLYYHIRDIHNTVILNIFCFLVLQLLVLYIIIKSFQSIYIIYMYLVSSEYCIMNYSNVFQYFKQLCSFLYLRPLLFFKMRH